MTDLEINNLSKEVVRLFKKRLDKCSELFSDSQKRAFVAEEVVKITLIFYEAEKINDKTLASASDIASIYRLSLESLKL
jgi:hypothetical protein